jgi:hypothetical protein
MMMTIRDTLPSTQGIAPHPNPVVVSTKNGEYSVARVEAAARREVLR